MTAKEKKERAQKVLDVALEIWPGVTIKVSHKDDQTVALSLSQMYSAPGASLNNLIALRDETGCDIVENAGSTASAGCDTCDYGSSYGTQFELIWQTPEKGPKPGEEKVDDLPWDDLKIAFSIDKIRTDRWEELFQGIPWPEGFEPITISGVGSRWCLIFRVEGPLIVESAREIRNIIDIIVEGDKSEQPK